MREFQSVGILKCVGGREGFKVKGHETSALRGALISLENPFPAVFRGVEPGYACRSVSGPFQGDHVTPLYLIVPSKSRAARSYNNDHSLQINPTSL